MRYFGLIYDDIIINKGLKSKLFTLSDNEIELTEQQFNEIKCPCKLVDSQFISCEIPIIEEEIDYTLEIMKLQKQLQDEDYKIIKCYEYFILDKDLPYDLSELHTKREEFRQKINQYQQSELIL